MSRACLRKLTLFNFRSFRGKHTLALRDTGLTILRGRNRDTRGDSGAGKTNLLRALAYGMGYCRIAAERLQCWFDDEPMWVEVELSVDGEAVTVHRSAKGVRIGKLRGRAAEDELDRICGVGWHLREALTYRDQLKPKKFLAMKDGELKEFLSRVLQLSGLEAEIDERAEALQPLREAEIGAGAGAQFAREKRDSFEAPTIKLQDLAHLEEALRVARSSLEAAGVQRDAARAQLLKARAEEEKTLEGMRAASKEKLDALTREFLAIRDAPAPAAEQTKRAELEQALAKCDEYLRSFEAKDAQQRAAYDASEKALRDRARHLHNELAKAPTVQDNLHQLDAEIAALEKDECPTCGKLWDNASAELKVKRHERLATLAAISALAPLVEESSKLDQHLAERRYQPEPYIERFRRTRQNILSLIEMEDQRAHYNERSRQLEQQRRLEFKEVEIRLAAEAAAGAEAKLHADQNRPAARLQKLVDQLASEHAVASSRVESAERSLALARQSNRVMEEQREAWAAARAKLDEAVADAEADHAEAKAALDRESDYVDLLKGFRNKIFDEALADISAEANQVLGMLPNAQHITVEFTHDGSAYDRVVPVTCLYGVPRSLDDEVNGGAHTGVNLAVDLAVARVVSRRLGCNLNWIVLDEAFNGHDSVTKQACLEMLQRYATDKLVIIVDHTTEFKEMFAQDISVEFQDKLSRIAE